MNQFKCKSMNCFVSPVKVILVAIIEYNNINDVIISYSVRIITIWLQVAD